MNLNKQEMELNNLKLPDKSAATIHSHEKTHTYKQQMNAIITELHLQLNINDFQEQT
uniref:Uncharacterized protein n=1 Tax=Rhizophora mucronata TaxID=61149 RepID=A0A2P2QCN7_RHIMU